MQKIIKYFINLLITLILILGILFITLFAFGIEPFVVKSGSMQPTIQTGSLSFINKHTKYENIKLNDIIAYETTNGSKVTHRVINITANGLETKGDSNNISDGITTTKENFIGKNIFSIPKLGYLINFIQTKNGKLMSITLIAVILTAGILNDSSKKKKYKQNQKN